MIKWIKIGSIAGAIALGVTILGIAAFAILQPLSASANTPDLVNARSESRMMFRSNMAGRFDQTQNHFGRLDRFGSFGRGERFGGQIDYDSLLAEALGISVEELQAAREKANAAAIQQALDQGLITPDQANLMAARSQLVNYLDRDALLAKALGISTEELQAAYDEGKPLVVLAWELKIDQDTLRTNMQNAHTEAIQQAVTDGVITQEQADLLQKNQPGGIGFRGHRGFGGLGR